MNSYKLYTKGIQKEVYWLLWTVSHYQLKVHVHIIIFSVFRSEPPRPPSKAQMLAGQAGENEHYGKSLLNLVKNKGFILLTITYGRCTNESFTFSKQAYHESF